MTKIADVIVPEVFAPYVTLETVRQNALFQSGIVEAVPGLSFAGKGGNTVNMPFWQDLTGDDEVLSDTSPLTPDKITADQDVAVCHYRGRAWTMNDLAKALSGDDPMRAIGDLVVDYWAGRMQTLLIAALNGVFSAASMSGLLHDISGLAGDLAVISANTTIDAAQKLGDVKAKLTAIVMHSAVEARLAKDDLIDYVQPSDGSDRVAYYLGKQVLVDDDLPAAAGVYTSYLFGPGAFGYAEGNLDADVAVETDRDSLQGDDYLINRRSFVLHPRGVKWIGAAAGVSPTNAELATDTNWERVYDVKQLRVVAFKHKIA